MNEETIRLPITCPVCFGRGRDVRFGEPCKRCSGSGHVFDEQPGDDDLYIKPMPLAEYERQQAELAALRTQVATLTLALEWYDDNANYAHERVYYDVDGTIQYVLVVDRDSSKLARETLAAVKSKE